MRRSRKCRNLIGAVYTHNSSRSSVVYLCIISPLSCLSSLRREPLWFGACQRGFDMPREQKDTPLYKWNQNRTNGKYSGRDQKAESAWLISTGDGQIALTGLSTDYCATLCFVTGRQCHKELRNTDFKVWCLMFEVIFIYFFYLFFSSIFSPATHLWKLHHIFPEFFAPPFDVGHVRQTNVVLRVLTVRMF